MGIWFGRRRRGGRCLRAIPGGAQPISAEDGSPIFWSEDRPEPIVVDDDEYVDSEVYAAAAEDFADEMYSAALLKHHKFASLLNLYMSNG
jgi:hypothetical protein